MTVNEGMVEQERLRRLWANSPSPSCPRSMCVSSSRLLRPPGGPSVSPERRRPLIIREMTPAGWNRVSA